MSLKRKFFIVVAAFMIGVSNVILEEDRMINDIKNPLEHIEEQNIDTDKDIIIY